MSEKKNTTYKRKKKTPTQVMQNNTIKQKLFLNFTTRDFPLNHIKNKRKNGLQNYFKSSKFQKCEILLYLLTLVNLVSGQSQNQDYLCPVKENPGLFSIKKWFH
jgi:hypothetical protein